MHTIAALVTLFGALAAAAAPPKVLYVHHIIPLSHLNSFFVLVDDLGFGDVGFNRNEPDAEVRTPNMDALAKDGVILTRHYVHRYCTPTRSSYISGRLPVHVQTSLANPEDSNCGIPMNMTGLGTVMKKANYSTAFVGKWDAGMATHEHTPLGRGFDESLVYFEHKNSFWTQRLYQSKCQTYDPQIVDLWTTSDGSDGPAYGLNGTAYEEYMFRDRIMSILDKHDVSKPLFLTYTPHVAHCPLQVPKDVLEQFNFTDDEVECKAQTPLIFPGSTDADYSCRAQYHAMVHILDENMGTITEKLKSMGVWDDTLMILSSDNGGPVVLAESGANNHPRKGSKYSEWEGGIRVAAMASGGYLPESVRGTVNNEMMHIADWYYTFAKMVGVDPTDHKAAAAGLPPIDGVDLWPVLSGQTKTSPRTEIPVSTQTLVQNQYKLITGKMGFAGWEGPIFPNSTSPKHPVEGITEDCGTGCLYDVVNDPTEHHNIAAENPALVKQMSDRLAELAKGFFSNEDNFGDGSCPSGIKMPCACYLAIHHYGEFFGPWALLNSTET